MNHISHSTARVITECQQKARFKIEGRTSKTPEAFLLGSAVHVGLETYEKTNCKPVSVEASLQYVNSYGNSNKYRPDAPDQTADDFELEHTLEEISAQCEEIISDVIDYPPEEWKELIGRTETVAIEDNISLIIPIEKDEERFEDETDDEYYERITTEVSVAGKPDLVLADHEQKILYIVDNKTAGKMAKISVTEKLQTAIYGMYYKSLDEYQDYEIIGVIRRILKAKRKKDLHIVTEIQESPITADMMYIAKYHLVASYLQAEQIEGDMLTTYGGLFSAYGCNFCDYKEICDGYQAFNKGENND